MVKGNLIAAGGVLAAAVAIIGVAGPANAGLRCDLGSSEKTHSSGIDAEAERIGFTSRDSKSCQDGWGRTDDGYSDDGFKGGFDVDSDDYGFDGDINRASYGDDKHGRDRGRGWGWIEPDDHGRTWGANGYRYLAATHNRH